MSSLANSQVRWRRYWAWLKAQRAMSRQDSSGLAVEPHQQDGQRQQARGHACEQAHMDSENAAQDAKH